jgi:phosphoribosyl 1,2-cyclic phosphodiesterase
MTSHRDPLTLHVLASGSSGNVSVISAGGRAILLDAGLSARRILAGLAARGIDAATLEAIVVTHEHSDHIAGARVLSRRLGIPVHMTEGTARAGERHVEGTDVRAVSAGDRLSIGEIEIQTFATDHDACEPIGCVFEHVGGDRIGWLTDSGRMTEQAHDALRDCDVLGIECNHDIPTLESGPYPWFLKRRILSAHGHLSNDSAAEAVCALATPRLGHVVALHLSDTNNTVSMAERQMSTALQEAGWQATVTVCAQAKADATAACS